ncbi:hypothetical protein [Flammeovirga sp. EKP202]|uniref:hypothetical protein n=1 Tax=Flammeovirga sp. EKP202 TaxID=2770592 RepID=UPI00165F4531|nr:hypothetical protein [Flammeovirga sp. EKP202]MBD0403947.1 hypothetical protein [Flammeovirga sp. EKP202]
MRNIFYHIILFTSLLFNSQLKVNAQNNYYQKAYDYFEEGKQLVITGNEDQAILKGDSALNYLTEAILEEGRTPKLLATMSTINWQLKGIFLTDSNKGNVYRNMVYGVKKGSEFLDASTLVGFIECMVSYQKNTNALDEDELWVNYWLVNKSLLDLEAKKTDSLLQICDEKLFSLLDTSCEGISHRFQKLGDNLEDVSVLQVKEVEKYFEHTNCDDFTSLINVKKVVFKNEPTAENAYELLRTALQSNDENFINEGMSICKEYMKGETEISYAIRLEMAKFNLKKGDKKSARNIAESLKGTSLQNEAFTFLGDLYFNSFMDIVSNKLTECQNLSVYSLAFDMYQVAENNSGMKKCKEKFPTKSMLFMENRKENEKVKFGGWVNRTTTLRYSYPIKMDCNQN